MKFPSQKTFCYIIAVVIFLINLTPNANAYDQFAKMQAVEEDLDRIENKFFQHQQTQVERENKQIENKTEPITAKEKKRILPFILDGYYKGLFSQSKTIGTKENYFGALQRLRLKAKSDFSEKWQVNVEYDLESIRNDFANTPDFETIRQKSQESLALWDAEHVISDTDHYYMKHSLYRAYLRYYTPEFQATIGKQKIDWGRTRFWSPVDLFNPVNPLDIEYQERVGADAINLEYQFGTSSSINAIYAHGRNKKSASAGVKVSQTLGTADVFAIAGEFKEDAVVGVGFDGQVGNAGIRGETTFTNAENGDDYARAVIGAEYAFANTLTLLAEYFYNGGADTSFLTHINSFEYTSKVLTRNKHQLGLQAGYEFSPLVKTNHIAIYDFEGKSLFYNPELTYNLKQNLDLSVGTQLFWGKTASEYGPFENLYYLQSQLYF